MALTVSRAQQRPQVDIVEVMVRYGYFPSPAHEGIRFYEPGVDRDHLRDCQAKPLVTIPRRTLKYMAELALDDQTALRLVTHYAKTGELLSPHAGDVEAVVQARTERLERERAVMQDQMDRMQAQMAELAANMKPTEPVSELPPPAEPLRVEGTEEGLPPRDKKKTASKKKAKKAAAKSA